MDPTLLSIALGVGIGVLYKLASRATYKFASRHGEERFTQIVLAGVALRLFASVIVVVLVLVLTPVDVGIFVISLLVVMAIGLAHEVWWLHRHSESDGPGRRG